METGTETTLEAALDLLSLFDGKHFGGSNRAFLATKSGAFFVVTTIFGEACFSGVARIGSALRASEKERNEITR